jgi:4-hydroxybutyrate CoA-transferase
MPSDNTPATISRADIPAIINKASNVFIQGGVGEPSKILQILKESSQISNKINYTTVSIPGINKFSPCDFHPEASLTTFFMHGQINEHATKKNTRFLPLHYRDIYRFLDEAPTFDVAIIQVSPAGPDGQCSLGVSVDFLPAILNKTKKIIAQINTRFPAAINAPSIPYADLDYVFHADEPFSDVPQVKIDSTTEGIANNVCSLIDDGSCLQIGIGKLPGTILGQLNNHSDLGIHSGLIGEATQTLIENGVINGARKTLDKNKHVTGLALGGPDFSRWAAQHADIVFKPVNYTHEYRTISAIDRFTSINSALEVDLFGQANAEMINGRQVSATGGLVDFIRGARGSNNGKSILALPATANKGAQSRISVKLSAQSMTSVCRADVDYVVTEYGVAPLFRKSTEQRAQALIDIAAPDFRDELWRQWEQINQ